MIGDNAITCSTTNRAQITIPQNEAGFTILKPTIVVIGLCSDTAITQHEKRFAFAKAPDLAQNLRNVHRAVKGTKVGFRGGILTKIHYSHLGASFALVSVPVARVGGTTISRTVKIDQR